MGSHEMSQPSYEEREIIKLNNKIKNLTENYNKKINIVKEQIESVLKTMPDCANKYILKDAIDDLEKIMTEK